MNCEKLSPICDVHPGLCQCGAIRQVSDTGLRTLAQKRGMVLLTGEQVGNILWVLREWKTGSPMLAEVIQIDAAIRELEGSSKNDR